MVTKAQAEATLLVLAQLARAMAALAHTVSQVATALPAATTVPPLRAHTQATSPTRLILGSIVTSMDPAQADTATLAQLELVTVAQVLMVLQVATVLLVQQVAMVARPLPVLIPATSPTRLTLASILILMAAARIRATAAPAPAMARQVLTAPTAPLVDMVRLAQLVLVVMVSLARLVLLATVRLVTRQLAVVDQTMPVLTTPTY